MDFNFNDLLRTAVNYKKIMVIVFIHIGCPKQHRREKSISILTQEVEKPVSIFTKGNRGK